MRPRDWWRAIMNRIVPDRVRYSGPLFSRSAGMVVNVDSALSQSVFWGCIRVLQNAISPLEWQQIQERPDGSKMAARGTVVGWLLNKQANPEMTAMSWRETALMHACATGNHYSEIERDGMGRPIWLWPIAPERVQPDRDVDGNLIYRVSQPAGGQAIIPARNMFHLHGPGWDGLVGMSILDHGRRSIGAGLAMDEYAGNFYANGTHVGLVFTHPGVLSDKADERLRNDLKARTGPGNAYKPFLLEEGTTVDKVAMSMVDAQFDACRRYGAADIARWFGVPLHMLAELDRSTNNNIEHQSIEFVRDAVLPWCRRLEQEADLKLFGVAAQRITCTRLDVTALQQGDLESRYNAYNVAHLGGWLCADEIRAMEGYNPIPDGKGKIFLQPMNYVEAGTDPEPKAIPAPARKQDERGSPAAKPDNVVRREEARQWFRARAERSQ